MLQSLLLVSLLLIVILMLVMLARKVKIAYPIILVLGGFQGPDTFYHFYRDHIYAGGKKRNWMNG